MAIATGRTIDHDTIATIASQTMYSWFSFLDFGRTNYHGNRYISYVMLSRWMEPTNVQLRTEVAVWRGQQ